MPPDDDISMTSPREGCRLLLTDARFMAKSTAIARTAARRRITAASPRRRAEIRFHGEARDEDARKCRNFITGPARYAD